jgi:predicted metalloprotease with PDZ domain
MLRLTVDTTDAPRKIIHSHLSLSAREGKMTLVYPKWIQGEHGPTGPITEVVGLEVRAGQRLPWSRDPLDMYAVNFVVPSGAAEIEVVFDYLLPAGGSGFSAAPSSTTHLLSFNWNQVLMYPAGIPARDVTVSSALRLPEGWKYGSALRASRENGREIQFENTALDMLIDSPVLMGEFFRTIELTPGEPKHFLHLAGDSAEALRLKPDIEKAIARVPLELETLFGSHPFREYHFLLALSDHVAHFGLEHHQSSENRIGERAFLDKDLQNVFISVLSHEMTHSWNGKYRRPAGLVRSDFQEPLDDELLWVYEGLTHHLGHVIAARSGLWDPQTFREALANLAALEDNRSGRRWRPLVDTCIAASLLYPSSDAGKNCRRDVDFYEEGALIWLEADTVIRQRSQGAKSLDDFCKLFHGGQNGAPAVKPYGYKDVIDALNQVLPFDWNDFFQKRIYRVNERAPLAGIESSGWKLASTNSPTDLFKAEETRSKIIDLSYSMGLILSEEGGISDVVHDSAADKAGAAPGMKLVGVNGRKWSREILRQAVKDTNERPLELLIEDADFFKTLRLDYRGGERYPVLERDESREDLLSKIIASQASIR